MEFRKNTDTPEEFLNHTSIKKENYSKDSNGVLKQFRCMLHNREQSFYTKDYFDSTQLIVDSILYNPDFSKLAVLIITKKTKYRQLTPDSNSTWYFDATCYLGIRQGDSIILSWIGPNFTNSNDLKTISNEIREACFRTFITKDTSDAYDYNLNDIHFWDSRIWKKIEDEKIKKQEFEEEKKRHPENIYEPK
jgi:hypothetical protein